MVPKSKYCQIYLEISTPVNLVIYKILYLKYIFKPIGPKFKDSNDLIENLHSRNFEDIVCRSNMDILRCFTET